MKIVRRFETLIQSTDPAGVNRVQFDDFREEFQPKLRVDTCCGSVRRVTVSDQLTDSNCQRRCARLRLHAHLAGYRGKIVQSVHVIYIKQVRVLRQIFHMRRLSALRSQLAPRQASHLHTKASINRRNSDAAVVRAIWGCVGASR